MYGAWCETSTPLTSRGLNLKRASTSKAGSSTSSTMKSGLVSRHAVTSGLRHAGSSGPPTAIVPPRFGVCAEVPPAPETARSETAIAARSAVGRITSSQGESSASSPHGSTETDWVTARPPDAERGSPKYEKAALRWLRCAVTILRCRGKEPPSVTEGRLCVPELLPLPPRGDTPRVAPDKQGKARLPGRPCRRPVPSPREADGWPARPFACGGSADYLLDQSRLIWGEQ